MSERRGQKRKLDLEPTVADDDDDANANVEKVDFCCGNGYTFSAQPIKCLGRNCDFKGIIDVNTEYYAFEKRYNYCRNCYEQFSSQYIVAPVEELETGKIIERIAFELKTNGKEGRVPEDTVNCFSCDKKFHSICVMHESRIHGPFICSSCAKKDKIRRVNKFKVSDLRHIPLTKYLEDRLESYLQTFDIIAGKLHVRVPYSVNKVLSLEPRMKGAVENGQAIKYPYRDRAIFVFQERGNIEVAIFAFLVQEYGQDCPLPNRGHIYLSYVDSVQFFYPRGQRTKVYQEILLGYFDYMRRYGFSNMGLWVCPPGQGGDFDYIFNAHPISQLMPNVKRLVDWYVKLLKTGKELGIMDTHKTLLDKMLASKSTSPTDIPYFEGDHWPKVIENCIEKWGDQIVPKKKKHGRHSRRGNRVDKFIDANYDGLDMVMRNVYKEMYRVKDTFLCAPLIPKDWTEELRDPEIFCNLLKSRDLFVLGCRALNYEFSTLRRAKHSTKVILYDMHQNKWGELYCACCNSELIVTWYECTACSNYELCEKCFASKGHKHRMKGVWKLEQPDRNQLLSQEQSPTIMIGHCTPLLNLDKNIGNNINDNDLDMSVISDLGELVCKDRDEWKSVIPRNVEAYPLMKEDNDVEMVPTEQTTSKPVTPTKDIWPEAVSRESFPLCLPYSPPKTGPRATEKAIEINNNSTTRRVSSVIRVSGLGRKYLTHSPFFMWPNNPFNKETIDLTLVTDKNHI